jgi:hypothetical protein
MRRIRELLRWGELRKLRTSCTDLAPFLLYNRGAERRAASEKCVGGNHLEGATREWEDNIKTDLK